MLPCSSPHALKRSTSISSDASSGSCALGASVSDSEDIDSNEQGAESWSSLAPRTDETYNNAEKWVRAALRKLDQTEDQLLLANFDPNDQLASKILTTIGKWNLDNIVGRDAGVVDRRPFILDAPPSTKMVKLARCWLLRHVTRKRAAQDLSAPPKTWADNLANNKGISRQVIETNRKQKAASGALQASRHDIAPTFEQYTRMTHSGLTGDPTVHCDALTSCETGAALCLYMSTGSRTSELKNMRLHSIGAQLIQQEVSGMAFSGLKLTAHNTKSKVRHENAILCHSNAWRCGIGMLGVCVLVRVHRNGPPPFDMMANEGAWFLFEASDAVLDLAMKAAIQNAGIRRKTNDVVGYVGRHAGTRILQHAGGTAEGSSVRTGHAVAGSAKTHYIETPLPDQQRVAGIDTQRPFIPAHLQPSLHPYADAVADVLFPALRPEEERIEARQQEVDSGPAKVRARVRTEEQLNERQKFLSGLRTATRTGVACLVARPRAWQRAAIAEAEQTLWETGRSNRVVELLFANNQAATEAMNALAKEVRVCEDSEIAARKASPEQEVSAAVVDAIQQASRGLMEVQQAHMSQVRQSLQAQGARVELPPPSSLPEPTGAVHASILPPVPVSARPKREPVAQTDTIAHSTWKSIREAVAYYEEVLMPREATHGAKWRIIPPYDDAEGNRVPQNRSRHKQWGNYQSIATAVRLQEVAGAGMSREQAIGVLERFSSMQSWRQFRIAAETANKEHTCLVFS